MKKHLCAQFLSTTCARNLKFGQVGVLIGRKKRYVGIFPILCFYPYFDPSSTKKWRFLSILHLVRAKIGVKTQNWENDQGEHNESVMGEI